ncbi:PREDICTED: atherin-like [Colobus angolensis palliatus]|uniref:atherin-like n=1 Tax=Colobus angolensis palliatus TaxID=336983 RepID=UPI0005F53C64|nr:PREDICTED: atherin-like [Colobus angolensis palliatus]
MVARGGKIPQSPNSVPRILLTVPLSRGPRGPPGSRGFAAPPALPRPASLRRGVRSEELGAGQGARGPGLTTGSTSRGPQAGPLLECGAGADLEEIQRDVPGSRSHLAATLESAPPPKGSAELSDPGRASAAVRPPAPPVWENPASLHLGERWATTKAPSAGLSLQVT